MLYTAGEAAKILGIPASTLRYYDKEGLLPELERSSGGMRMFRDSDFASLRLIQCLKKAGLPLKEIRDFIRLPNDGQKTINRYPVENPLPSEETPQKENGRA